MHCAVVWAPRNARSCLGLPLPSKALLLHDWTRMFLAKECERRLCSRKLELIGFGPVFRSFFSSKQKSKVFQSKKSKENVCCHFSSWLGLEAEKVIVHGPAFHHSEALMLRVKYLVLECSGINAFNSNVFRFLSIQVFKCSGINAFKSNVLRFLNIKVVLVLECQSMN